MTSAIWTAAAAATAAAAKIASLRGAWKQKLVSKVWIVTNKIKTDKKAVDHGGHLDWLVG